MRKTILALFLLATLFARAQNDTITQRIFLIGDPGELYGANGTQPIIDWLQKHVNWNDTTNTAIFLGDNIYPLGMPAQGEPGYKEAKEVMDYLRKPFIGKKAKAYFIPGNHDWENGKMGGLQRVRNQYNYINSQGDSNIVALPQGGCPGPVTTTLGNQVVVVFVDSQWFLYIHDKPGPSSSCVSRTPEEFGTELKEIAANHQNQLLLIVTHHPIYSYGVHGGDYTWKEHLFPLTAINKKLWIPLPVIGSIYPIARGIFGNLQDVKHPLYQNMAKNVEAAMRLHPNAIIASGHDHSLQLIQRIIQKDTLFQIISGSSSQLSRVEDNKEGKLLFEDAGQHGFALLEVHKSGKVFTKYYNVNSKDLANPIYVRRMNSIAAPPEVISEDSIPVLPASAQAAANPKLYGTGFRNFLVGKNYRQEWTTPVNVPVLDIGSEMGGLTPTKQGGGKQTRSLRVEDSTGKEWALRSVQKFPDAAIPPDLRETFLQDLVNQGISAAYPYGSLSVGPLARAAGIPYHRKKLVYIPDDPRLGRYRSTFKNTLAIMEERMPEGVAKKDNTDEVVLKLAKDNDDHVDQVSVLNARLLDNFYMDFDRHEGQWDWATRDTGKGKIYYPIPKDQDQVFFVNQGLLPYFVKRPWLVPELQGFRKKAYNIRTFNKAARNFDRFFLNELDRQTWSRQIDSFLSRMTDNVIEQALQEQPDEVRPFHYEKIVNTLKERRRYFKDEMLTYYNFISRQVNIVGTNQRELFTIDKLPENRVRVTLHKITKSNAVSTKIYDRTFDGRTTRELMIYGLEGRDSFVVRGGHTGINIRVIGGPGEDWFVNESTAGRKINVYDVSFEENHFAGNAGGFRKKISDDPRNNEYDRIYYQYNYFQPSLTGAYNVDDGLFLGLRGEVVTHGFRKEPFSTQHIFKIGHALRTHSYYFTYDGDFTRLIGRNDLLIRSDLDVPVNVTNFFGFGNTTTFDRNKPGGEQYYRARYSSGNLSVLLRRHLQSWMRINYGPAFQYFHIRKNDNADKYIAQAPLPGVDEATLYNRKTFLGFETKVDINSRNDPHLPTRGVNIDAGIKQLFGLNNSSNNLLQAHVDLGLLASLGPDPKLVFGLRFGWAKNYGAYDIPQAQYLSGTENLRGFRRNRFAGRSLLFFNTEVRWKVKEFSTYLFPGSIGLLFFNDVGRVWADEQRSTVWHDGYGGGIWLAPIRRWVITATLAHSREEKLLPYVSLGFRF